MPRIRSTSSSSRTPTFFGVKYFSQWIIHSQDLIWSFKYRRLKSFFAAAFNDCHSGPHCRETANAQPYSLAWRTVVYTASFSLIREPSKIERERERHFWFSTNFFYYCGNYFLYYPSVQESMQKEAVTNWVDSKWITHFDLFTSIVTWLCH